MHTRPEGRMTTLKRLRLERQLSLRALGEMLDTSYMTIWRWESMQCEPKWRNVRRLERMFNLPIETLLSNEKATTPR